MSESKKDNSQDSEPSLRPEAQKLLEELKGIKEQAEAYLKQAEVARKNADSEALLASNAKKYCEEHATTVSNVKGAVETDATAIATNKQRADEAVAALTTAKANVDGDVQTIATKRKEVEQAATNVEQASDKVVKAAEAAGAKLKEVEALKESTQTVLKTSTEAAEKSASAASSLAKTAEAAATNADKAQKQSEQSSLEATEYTAKIAENYSSTNKTVEETKSLLTQAEADEVKLKKVLEHLAKSDEISTGYEKRVEDLKTELQSLIARVEGLLPGATSAGLASSFNKQRSRFEGPQKQFLRTFVTCIIVLVALALPSFFSAIGWSWWDHSTDKSWNAAWRSLTLRLPIVLPVVWLAIYAGRNYMMSLRMEEDYAYKEAISTAFEGYKREMEKITASDGENPTPLTILCVNILRAISERPGRIYEGKQRDITLAAEAQAIVEKGADFGKKKLAAS
jgi:chemotaxis protein histidine kinase CheA